MAIEWTPTKRGGKALRPLFFQDFRGSAAAMLAYVLGTGLGTGLSARAPGTFGSLLGLALAYAAWDWPPAIRLIVLGALILLGIWAAAVVTRITSVPDHPSIVIDEVAGMWITAWMLDFQGWLGPILAFILFRVLDILKPMPIRWVDRWSKGQVVNARGSPAGAWWAGFGVMADDLVAGALGLLILYFTQWVHV